MDLLLVNDENKSHYVYIKDFDRFMFHKTKNKNKKHFCKSCLQCFSSKNVLTKYKEVCLSVNGSYSKKCQDHIPCSFAYKLVCVDDEFTKPTVVFSEENAAYESVKAILKECQHCKKVMKERFNKNLIMSEEDKEQFQSSNACWICEKLMDDDNEKVRDHCHITGKF